MANVSYFVVLDQVLTQRTALVCSADIHVKATVGLSNTVALDFGKAVFGRIGGTVFAAMVAFSCFGALNGV